MLTLDGFHPKPSVTAFAVTEHDAAGEAAPDLQKLFLFNVFLPSSLRKEQENKTLCGFCKWSKPGTRQGGREGGSEGRHNRRRPRRDGARSSSPPCSLPTIYLHYPFTLGRQYSDFGAELQKQPLLCLI